MLGIGLSLTGRLRSSVSIFSPVSLFSSNEPGIWLDPSDLTTLFQDTAGTTPVTTPGQTVALALDKSKGLVLGSEAVVNGNFTTDTDWVKGTGWTISGGLLSVGALAGQFSSTGQTVADLAATNAGKTFLITLTVSNYVVGPVALQNGNNTVIFTASANGTYSFYYVVPAGVASGRLGVQARGATGTNTFTIDNISVKELPGFHATQATLASRPTYGIVPLGGRRNLLTRTEEFDNAVWGKLTAGDTVSANAGVAPDSTTTAENYVPNTTNSSGHIIRQSWTAVLGQPYVMSVYAKANGYDWLYLSNNFSASDRVWFNLQTGSVGTVSGGATSATMTSVGNGWYRCSFVTANASATGPQFQISIATGDGISSFAGNGTSGILIWGAQLETGSSATAYQRVGSAFDVTEAGVASLSYLSFDGVDDFLVTPTITPGIDKVTVGAGLRKLSDVAQGMIYEHGFDSDVFLIGPLNTGVGNYGFRSAGTLSSTASASGFAAPVTNVVTGLGDISADLATLRVNGSQVAQATADQGTGNYTPQISYIGRRQGTSLPFNGQLYSLVVRFAATDLATVGQLESWINGKTGAYS